MCISQTAHCFASLAKVIPWANGHNQKNVMATIPIPIAIFRGGYSLPSLLTSQKTNYDRSKGNHKKRIKELEHFCTFMGKVNPKSKLNLLKSV